jgi:glycosyltransferase domain-containing protein
MTKTYPLVSIGVPTYNRPLGIKRVLDCLTSQTYPNLEIVISDNCSTDPEVEKVIGPFLHDKRIRYIRHATNMGPNFNFQFVFEQSTGEYFKFLADDDWVDLNYIEECLNFLREHPSYSSAYGICKIYSADGIFIQNDVEINLEQEKGTDRVLTFYEKVSFNSIFYGITKRELVSNYFSFENVIAIDWLVMARYAFRGKCKLLHTTHQYLSQGGISRNIDSLAATFNMSPFIKYYPHLNIGMNVYKDIMRGSKAYDSLPYAKRLLFALRSFFVIYNTHSVTMQLLSGTKKYFQYVMAKK